MRFVITCMPGLSVFLAEELTYLGLKAEPLGTAAVSLQGEAQAALKVCLWSRVAERVLLPLAEVKGEPFDALSSLLATVDWQYWGASQRPIHWAVEHGQGVKGDYRISRQRLINLQPSDMGIQREPEGALCLRAVLNTDGASLYVDLSGDTLQRRGYRLSGGQAPLRETLAAGMLWALAWPQHCQQTPVLVDPFCGSGTLLIEAAAMALRHAPGLLREHHGFEAWPEVTTEQWQALKDEALAQQVAPSEEWFIRGFDSDGRAIQAAKENAQRAGLAHAIEFERRELAALTAEHFAPITGFVATNPPWGERLEEQNQAAWLFSALGHTLGRFARQWLALLVASKAEVLDKSGMELLDHWRVKNGPFQVYIRRLQPQAIAVPLPLLVEGEFAFELPEQALPLANRLRKNSRQLKRWIEREGIHAYRLYDKDLPEFNFAVDIYGENVLVYEYAPPKSVDDKVAAERRQWALMAVRAALGVHREQVFVRTREQQKGRSQYEKVGAKGEYKFVYEGRARVLVNLEEYLDTGLFLDHRPLRVFFSEGIVRNKRFLNLFGYTGVATLHAALGGARRSITVDASQKYLDWAANNLAANGVALAPHQMVRADAMQWLAECKDTFDVIFCDPPTFSNSKDRQDFVVQRDHVTLIRRAMKCLAQEGTLYFSCNFRRFVLDETLARDYEVKDITTWSIPPDFSRNQRIHYCFAIRHRS